MSTTSDQQPDDRDIRWSAPGDRDPHSGYDPTGEDMAFIARLAERSRARMQGWQRLIERRPWLRLFYRLVLILVATLVILAGIAMLVLPGPGWLTIFLGLAILGSEFAWARRFLGWLRQRVQAWWHRYRSWRQRRSGEAAET